MSTIAYDEQLQADLIEHGLEALREHGRMEVKGMDDPARYNSAIWFVMAHGLEYVRAGDLMILTRPDGSRPEW